MGFVPVASGKVPKLLSPGDLPRIPARRFRDERLFWERIRDRDDADLLRLMVVDLMLNGVLNHPEGIEESVETSRVGAFVARIVRREDRSAFVVGGLGLSQFIRRVGFFDNEDILMQYGEGDESGIGGVLDTVAAENSVRLHLQPDALGVLMPEFDPDLPSSWYRDGVSVVRVQHPADITPSAAQLYSQDTGRTLDPSSLATVTTHLTHGYLR